MSWRSLIAFTSIILLNLIAAMAYAQSSPFAQWLDEFRIEAVSKGIPASVVDAALNNLEEDPRVVELDQKQPEEKATFTQYASGALNKKRVLAGREMLKKHRTLLKKISKRYGVQPQYIVALWGIETDYGKRQGNFSVVQSLATLAYEGRRADFFREELLNALHIIATKHIAPQSLTGSWAGAMGNCQFMPSSYLKYAVDWNKDGRTNIWSSHGDTFASIANYLKQSGWDGKQGWGRAATPDDTGDIIVPGDEDEGAFVVTSNYHVLLKWNRSRYFALSVGMLADKLVE